MPVERIADAADLRLEDYRDLPRRGSGAFVAEGRRLVRRLLAASRFRARSVLVTEAALADLSDVLDDGVQVYVAAEHTIRDVVGFRFHMGCLAAGEPREESTPSSLFA